MRPRAVSLALLLPLALALLSPARLRAEVVNRVVLRINDQIATLYDYEQRRQDFVREISRRDMDAEQKQRTLAQSGEIVFKDIFEDLLLDSRARQLAIEISDAQIDAAMVQMKQNFGIKSDEEFRAALAQSGLTEPQLREQIRGQLRAREVMEKEVRSRIKVNEEDLRRYYRKNVEQFRLPEQFHLREVVVLAEGGAPSAEERARVAAAIRQAVAGGKPLADAIAEYQPKGVTGNVIDLGWVAAGDLDPNLQAAAWKLKPGEITEPIAGRGGLHLMQLIEHRESRIQAFSEVSGTIQSREQDRVYNQELLKYMAELEQKSLIVADPPPEAAGFRHLIKSPEAGADDLSRALGTPPAAPAKAEPAKPAGPPNLKTPAAKPAAPPPQVPQAPQAPPPPS